jgi:hypothetical protein
MLVRIMPLPTPRDVHHTAIALLEGTEIIAQDVAEGLKLGVSHLLHMAFLPWLCGSLSQPCLVEPAMESLPRLLRQREVLPYWAGVGRVLGQ